MARRSSSLFFTQLLSTEGEVSSRNVSQIPENGPARVNREWSSLRVSSVETAAQSLAGHHTDTDTTTTSEVYTDSTHNTETHPSYNNTSGFSDLNDGNSSTISDKQTIPPLTIVVQLMGEMGNNLGKIACGICLQEYLKQDFDTPSKIVLRHQDHPKWIRGYHNLVKCFPWTRQFDFGAANTPSFKDFQQNAASLDWWATMEQVNHESTRQPALQHIVNLRRNNSGATLNVTLTNGERISDPFILSTAQGARQSCYDRFYDIIRDHLAYEHDTCCGQLPFDNETVFVSKTYATAMAAKRPSSHSFLSSAQHFRNFLEEMPRVGKRLGFEELNPRDTATKLLGHLDPNVDQVAIIARARDMQAAVPYVEELGKRNIVARIVSSPHDVHDFCFLKRTQRELVGISQSTFAGWAGLLSDTAAKVRLYSVNSTATRAAHGEGWFRQANWTHPHLKDRYVYVAFDQDD